MASAPPGREREYQEKFQHLISKFSSLLNGRSEGDRKQLNILLDELNALDLKAFYIDNPNKAVLIINQCCSFVPPSDTFMVAKACQLFSNLITKQHVIVEGKTLSLSVKWCVESLKHGGEVAVADILVLLEVLVRGNGSLIEKVHELIGGDGILISLLSDGQKKNMKLATADEITYLAVRCLEALVFVNDNDVEGLSDHELQTCIQVFLQQLKGEDLKNEELHSKLVLSSLQGLLSIFQQSPSLLGQHLGEVLGAVKAYMLFGMPNHTGLKPTKVFPSPLGQLDFPCHSSASRDNQLLKRPQPSRRQKQLQSRKGNDQTEETKSSLEDRSSSRATGNDKLDPCSVPSTWYKTSDSEYSDAEGGQGLRQNTSTIQRRVRQTALSLFMQVIKITESRVLFGYWPCFIPDYPNMLHSHSLLACLLNEPSPKNRISVTGILIELLRASKTYLASAESSDKRRTSFTTFATTVGNMLKELHHSLCLAVIAENSVLVLTQLLKCMATLVRNTPYHRLGAGLLTKLIRNVKPFFHHRDSNVQVASLTVMNAVVSIEPPLLEVSEILNRVRHVKMRPDRMCMQEDAASKVNERAEDASDEEDESSEWDSDIELCKTETKATWLMEICLKSLGAEQKCDGDNFSWTYDNRQGTVPVKLECLQVLVGLSKNYFRLVGTSLTPLAMVLESGLNDPDSSVQLHSGRVVEAIGGMMQQEREGSENLPSLIEVLAFWKKMLATPLPLLIQSASQPSLRAVGCDCLANVGAQSFEQLSTEEQKLCVTWLLSSGHDKENNVRAAAVRALGIYVVYPILREDVEFVVQTAKSVISSLQDENLGVRVKAAWAVGNLSDALVLNKENGNSYLLPDFLLLDLFSETVKASQDNEKVKCYAVRAVGNLLKYANEEMVQKCEFKEMIEKAIMVLIKTSSSGNNMKVRWNSCYALGSMLRNSALYLESENWQSSVYATLTSLVQNFKNFKVRINAAAALAIPDRRVFYKNCFLDIWSALLVGLDNSQNMEDFSEYKHRDNLMDQICLTLCHLASLIAKEDLVPLQDVLMHHFDMVQHHMVKFQERVVPDKAGDLINAAAHVTSLMQDGELSIDWNADFENLIHCKLDAHNHNGQGVHGVAASMAGSGITSAGKLDATSA